MIKIKLLGAAFAASMGLLSVGIYVGWASPTISKLLKNDSPINLTEDEASLVIALLKVGSALGCIISIFFVDFIGRKGTILLSIIPTMIGWIIILLAKSPTELYIARVVGGIANGLTTTTLPIYLAEISPAGSRGRIGSFSTFVMYAAIIFAYGIGPFINMRHFAETGIIISLLHCLIFIWFPETPYYFIKKKYPEAAEKSLKFLRSESDISEEFESIKRATFMETEGNWKLRDVFTFSKEPKSLVLGIGVMLITISSGEILLINNAESIFDHIKGQILDSRYLSLILPGLQVIICGIFSLLLDYIGRKLLLMISCIGVVTFSFLVGCYFFIQDMGYQTSHLGWIPIVLLTLIVASSSIGATTILYIFFSELFSMKMKAIYSGICMFITFLCAFATLEIFAQIVNHINFHTAFWALSAVNIWNVAFVYAFLPETKLKTLEEIQITMTERK